MRIPTGRRCGWPATAASATCWGRSSTRESSCTRYPSVCRRPGPGGFFDTPYFASAIGMVGAGGSLVYQHVYGTVVPILSNLIHPEGAVPSTAELASVVDRVTTTYVRSLGRVRPA